MARTGQKLTKKLKSERERIDRNPKPFMLRLARNRAKVKGLPFDLTEDDFDIPVFCPVRNVKLERGREGNNDDAPSLDRIVPSLGYVRGNVVVVSMKANRMKNDGSPEELRRIADFYTKLMETKCPNKITRRGGESSETATASRPRKKTVAKKTKNAILIDGDIFVYWAAFGTEREVLIEEDEATYTCDLDAAKDRAEELVWEVSEALGSDNLIVTLSDEEDNFRKKLSPGYKAQRKSNRKPLGYKTVRNFIAKKYGVKVKKRLEADDVLGILATHPTLVKADKKIIVSTDKDLLQIPGRHYNPKTEEKRMVSDTLADRHFLKQALMGDAVDNYPGCPGIGPKRADAILYTASMSEPTKGTTPDKLRQSINAVAWKHIVKAYEKAGLAKEDALLQARLARILRYTDYNFKKKEPILWTP